MKKLSLILFTFVVSLFLTNCSNEDDNYKMFEGPQEALFFNTSSTNFEYTASTPAFVEVLVSSTTKSNVARTIPVIVSPLSTATSSQYSIDMTTAVIPAGQTTAKLKINSGSFSALPTVGASQLILLFGSGYHVLPNRTNHVVNIQRGCADTRVNLNILFDGYASEISWQLRNSSNTLIASSSPYADGLTTFNTQFCLPAGTYSFRVTDSYGDGLSYPSNGSYTLKLTNGTTLVSGGGNFGSLATHSFTIN